MIPQFFVLRKGVHAGVNGLFVYPSSCTVHIVVCHAEDMWIVRKFADPKANTIYRINIFHNDEVNRNGAQLIFIFFFCPLFKYICR